MSVPRRLAVLGATALLLGGCAHEAEADHGASSAPPASVPVSTRPPDVAERAPEEAGGTVPELNEASDVVKDLGQAGGLTDPDSARALFSITVLAVERHSSCEGRAGRQTPQHGGFLFVHVEAEMATDIAPDLTGSDGFLPLVREAWELRTSGGTAVSGANSEAAWACLTRDELLPARILPGESVAGILVLDSDLDAGSVVYDPGGTGGWAWRF